MFKRLISVILATVLLVSGCTTVKKTVNQNVGNSVENVVPIKFITLDVEKLKWIVIEERDIKNATPEIVINELLKFPHIFPEGSKLLNIEVKEQIAYVDISKEFDTYNLGTTGIVAIIFSIVNTLCLNETLGIKGVKFLMEGKENPPIGEAETSQIFKPNIKLSDLELAINYTIEKYTDTQSVGNNKDNTAMEEDYIKLLYPDAGVEYWLVEEKKLPVDARAVVEELIKNEKNFIPKETKILDIKVENRIAYINLSKEFEELSNGDTVIWINIFTIVNTLTLNKSPNIDSVQFLLEGKVEQFIGDTITDKPLSKNVELMKMY